MAKAVSWPVDRRAQVERIEAAAGDFQALVERGEAGAQLGELARLQRSSLGLLAAQHLGAAAVWQS